MCTVVSFLKPLCKVKSFPCVLQLVRPYCSCLHVLRYSCVIRSGTSQGSAAAGASWERTASRWGWQNIGTGCSVGLWSLLLRRHSESACTCYCVTWFRYSCSGRGIELSRSLLIPNILWFCVITEWLRLGRTSTGHLLKQGHLQKVAHWLYNEYNHHYRSP